MFFQLNLLRLPLRSAPLVRKLCVSPKLSKVEPVSMSYKSYGDKEADPSASPVVIMHGLFGSKRNWTSLSKQMSKKSNLRRRIITVDARNHGDSPWSEQHTYTHLVEDIRELYARLNLNVATLIGHSMGGRAMMYFALNYPDLVDKLVVVDISPVRNSPNLESMPELFKPLQNVQLPHGVSQAQGRKLCDEQLEPHITDKALRAFFLTNLVRENDGSFKWQTNIPVLSRHFYDHLARFPEVNNVTYRGPTFFIAGANSDYIDESDHSQILDLFPHARFAKIGNAGHWVHSEKPGEFLELCLGFLNKR